MRLNVIQDIIKHGISPVVQYNTGTLVDYMTGSFVPGVHGHWYLQGGLSNLITGLGGRNGTYKSTLMTSFMVRMLAIYLEAEGVLADSEFTIIRDMERVRRFTGELGNIGDRIAPVSATTLDINDLFQQIQTIVKQKSEAMKECMALTPFVDFKTGKQIKAWIPTPYFVDSYSELAGANEDELVDVEGVTGKKTKTIYMVEGGNKTTFMRRVRRLCEQYGILLLLTAHIDDNREIGSMAGPRKQMVHMKQSDALKNVGSSFKKLTNPYIHIEGCRNLNDSQTYPSSRYRNIDLNEIVIKISRGKTNMSGISLPLIMSQSDGLLSGLTNYHYLKSLDYFGLIGSKSRHKLALYPDVTLTRPTARDIISSDKKLMRALEIMSGYAMIKTEWNIAHMDVDFSRSGEEFAEAILKHPKLGKEKVLSSTGYWTFNPKKDDNYLSVMDMLKCIDG